MGFENEYFKVISRAPDKNGKIQWNCLCKNCNEYCIKNSDKIKKDKSCGCKKNAFENLTGKTFGYWQVLEDTQTKAKDGDKIWKCQCQCGTIKNVRGSSLKRGTSKSCGCFKKEKIKNKKEQRFIQLTKNIVGKKFSKLTVLEPVEQDYPQNSWKCLCECGNVCYRTLFTLQRNAEHSCDDCQKQRTSISFKNNLLGKKFGKLTPIRELNNRTNGGSLIWECQCDCGNIIQVRSCSLVSNNTQSCGCINKSIGEKNIENILQINKISFKKEWSIPELKLKRFDFAIFDNDNTLIRLVEFDGKQHYTDLSGLWNSQETLETIQKRDKEKNEWAKVHNIPLVRIPYWERDHITLDLIMSDKYLLCNGEALNDERYANIH